MKECILDEVTSRGQTLPIKVISAGTHAINGYPASEHAIEVSAQHGIDISSHRSSQLTEEIVNSSDLILTMEKRHTQSIRENWPQINCVYELKDFGHNNEKNSTDIEIIDPIGMTLDDYLDVFNQIKNEIVRVSHTIFSLAREKYSG